MTFQPVISEIATVATSLLSKVDLRRHPHAGATGVTGSLFLGSLPHTLYIVSCFSYAAGNSSNSSNYSTIGGAFQTVISNFNSPQVSTFHCHVPS